METNYDYLLSIGEIKAMHRRMEAESDKRKINSIHGRIMGAMGDDKKTISVGVDLIPSDLDAFVNAAIEKGYIPTVKRCSLDNDPVELIIRWD